MAGSLQSQDSILPADHYQLKTATVNFLKSHIIGIALGAILGLPAIVLGGSFTASLIQGKTPSEAIQILSERIDVLSGRVQELEEEKIQDINIESEVVATTSAVIEVKDTKPTITPDVDLSICAELKGQISVIDTKLLEKKKLLQQVKSGSSTYSESPTSEGEERDENYSETLKNTTEAKNNLESDIDKLENQRDSLREQLQQKSCQ